MTRDLDVRGAWRVLAAVVMAIAASPAEPAATQTVSPGTGDDFRAAFATSQDAAEGKRLADTTCARCHGPRGVGNAKGVPHLAGQRAVYLHAALRAYKAGTRGQGMMTDAVRFLSDDALMKAAAWYSTLDPAQPGPGATGKPAAPALDPVKAGQNASVGCAACHGEMGISQIPGMPSLVGLAPAYLVVAMNAYKSGQRRHDTMKALVAGLGEADMGNIALFYSRQTPGRAKSPAAGNPTAGKAAAAQCAACHGAAGVSTGTAPSLAGQDAQYFVSAMRAYRDGSRAEPAMAGPATAVGDASVTDLAAYYASLPPQSPTPGQTPGPAGWAERCDRCHGVNGNSSDPRVPALAAQRADYLEKALNDYRNGDRKSPAMAAMSTMLTATDARMLAEHYASQSARAVVYVRLPGAQ